MKRDLDLIRSILMEVEETPLGHPVSDLEFEAIDPKIIVEHVRILKEAGLIEAELASAFNEYGVLEVLDYQIERLTWEGHDFIANARNQTIWKRTRALIEEKGGDVSFGVLRGLLTNIASQYFDLG